MQNLPDLSPFPEWLRPVIEEWYEDPDHGAELSPQEVLAGLAKPGSEESAAASEQLHRVWGLAQRLTVEGDQVARDELDALLKLYPGLDQTAWWKGKLEKWRPSVPRGPRFPPA